MPWYVRGIFDLLVSIGCLLGVFFGGVFTTIAWVCLVIHLIKLSLFVLTAGSGMVAALIAEIIVGIVIPCAAGFGLGLGVFHLGFLQCLFLSGAFTCTIGWILTIFEL